MAKKKSPHEIRVTEQCPETEFSADFLQGMVARMGFSFEKYGAVAKGFPLNVDAIGTLEHVLRKYKADGNTERLIDIANYAMIEFMHPRHPDAHFNAGDAKDSAGRKWDNGPANQRKNNGDRQI